MRQVIRPLISGGILALFGLIATVSGASANARSSKAMFFGLNGDPLSAYVQGRLAEADGQPLRSTGAYRMALASDPVSESIARRGYRQAIIAGDMALAMQSAVLLRKDEAFPADALLLLLIDAFDKHDMKEARRLADALVADQRLSFLATFARSWASVVDGPYDPPVVASNDPFSAYALRHLDDQLMLQRLVLGDGRGASEAYHTAKARGVFYSPSLSAILAPRFAELGEQETAKALGYVPTAVSKAKGRGAAITPPRIDPVFGLAVLLHRLTVDLSSGGVGAPVLSLFRLASFADPASTAIRLDVARALLAGGYGTMAFDEAGKIPVAAPEWLDAQAVRVGALAQQRQGDAAVLYARNLTLRPGAGVREFRLLGDILLQGDRFGEAAQTYAAALARPEAVGDARLFLQYGTALIEAGRWTEGKAQMEKALALMPDSPVILNHLAYSLVERGEEIPRAITMLQQATKLAPDEPAYLDSLGWAYFRAGQGDLALPLLEKAVASAPGESDISEHLGDVLWSQGRRFEARYAWAAAGVNASGEGKERIARKTERGPDGTNP